jgi:RNA-directed DNA polymerase
VNIYLNEFDQGMKKRGVRVIRYADDIVVLAKSKRAAKQLLEFCGKCLENKLRLQMNRQKLKELMSHSQDRKVRQVIEQVKVYIPEWIGYQWGELPSQVLAHRRKPGAVSFHNKRKARTGRIL